MKKIILFIFMLSMIAVFSACSDNKTSDIADSDSAYESMSVAVENGNFEEAMAYYENGAADSGEAALNSLYYHAHAMNCHEKKGCIGYSYDLINQKSTDMSAAAESSLETLRAHTESFDGAYQCNSYSYLYFSDGKIAIGDGVQLTGENYCSGELVYIDNVYYWANHNDSGDDTLLYKIEKTEDTVILTSVEGSADMYSGEYKKFPTDMPILMY